MKREIILTQDGSTTIHLPDWQESYHSRHGAVQEAYHVFIQNGLNRISVKPLRILEIGFGTGLNALITAVEAQKRNWPIHFTSVEAYPVSQLEWSSMNFAQQLAQVQAVEWFEKMHQCPWEVPYTVHPEFTLCKRELRFEQIDFQDQFDLIYFDAFGYPSQPELWSQVQFERMYQALAAEGLLVTYAARSVIKRNMQAAGFRVEKHPGPPGKREMFVAFKNT